MTQYSDKVEEVRLKQEADEWGKSIRYLHFNNGIEETQYNHGNVDLHYYTVFLQYHY
jgi:hypothetical protein